MNHKVKVKLPEVVVDKKEETSKIPPITISVTEAGSKMFLNDEPTTKQAIESRLSVEAQKTRNRRCRSVATRPRVPDGPAIS